MYLRLGLQGYCTVPVGAPTGTCTVPISLSLSRAVVRRARHISFGFVLNKLSPYNVTPDKHNHDQSNHRMCRHRVAVHS